MSNKIETIVAGGVGIGGIELSSVLLDTGNSTEVLDIVIKLVISLATLWKLLKKNKPKQNGNE
jgi:hypothetical protein